MPKNISVMRIVSKWFGCSWDCKGIVHGIKGSNIKMFLGIMILILIMDDDILAAFLNLISSNNPGYCKFRLKSLLVDCFS